MSRLLDGSKNFRDKLIAKNTFTSNDEYNVGHSNALSDGDEKGKGEKDGSVGSLTDIKQKETLIAKNTYNKGKEYDASRA